MKDNRFEPKQTYLPGKTPTPVVRVYKLGKEPKANRYWLTRSPEERLAMIEELRRAYYGEEYESQRDPEKVFKVTVRKRR